MDFPSSALLLVLDALDNDTFFRVRSVAPAWATTMPILCKRVLQMIAARIAGTVKNKMHENKKSRPQVVFDIPMSRPIFEMCFHGHWNHDSDGFLLARFDGPSAILSAFPNLPLAVHPVPNEIPTWLMAGEEPSVYSVYCWAGYESCTVKFNLQLAELAVSVRSRIIGDGNVPLGTKRLAKYLGEWAQDDPTVRSRIIHEGRFSLSDRKLAKYLGH